MKSTTGCSLVVCAGYSLKGITSTDIKYTTYILAAVLLLSCSKEDEADNTPTEPTTPVGLHGEWETIAHRPGQPDGYYTIPCVDPEPGYSGLLLYFPDEWTEVSPLTGYTTESEPFEYHARDLECNTIYDPEWVAQWKYNEETTYLGGFLWGYVWVVDANTVHLLNEDGSIEWVLGKGHTHY